MNAETILRIVSYTTASTLLATGIVVLTGFFMPTYIPDNFRITLGIVIVLYGIYRIVMLGIKRRNERDAKE